MQRPCVYVYPGVLKALAQNSLWISSLFLHFGENARNFELQSVVENEDHYCEKEFVLRSRSCVTGISRLIAQLSS